MVNSIGITRINGNGNGMQNGMFNDMEMRGKAPQQQRSEMNGNGELFLIYSWNFVLKDIF